MLLHFSLYLMADLKLQSEFVTYKLVVEFEESRCSEGCKWE